VLRRRGSGGFEYLFQHRRLQNWASKKSRRAQVQIGQNVWGLPGGKANTDDTYPILTAWREVMEECFGYNAIPLLTFLEAVEQGIHVSDGRFLFVVDFARFQNIPAHWAGEVGVSPVEVCYTKVRSGHIWVQERELDVLLGAQSEAQLRILRGIQVWPLVLEQCSELRFALGVTAPQFLFHGTSVENCRRIFEQGFRVSRTSVCSGTYSKCRPPLVCCCRGMLGAGVYLAGYDKAESNSGRTVGVNAEAVVLRCAVTVGVCKVVTPFSRACCDCGCGSLFSDHLCTWHYRSLFDSVLLLDGAGVKRWEFCVCNPTRVQPLEFRRVRWNDNREVVFRGDWEPFISDRK